MNPMSRAAAGGAARPDAAGDTTAWIRAGGPGPAPGPGIPTLHATAPPIRKRTHP
ncbi:hypothetical protein GCM10010466_42690 [Planomonospora alba]|uniref:Uncharacterized protein n=1 Tax=Planomonospora alba TaxID=161354 RepID=A0ABP6NHS9_9ACTN